MESNMESNRMTGTVKWFSRVKGYGFIAPDDGGKEIFVHFSGIEGEGYRNLEENQCPRLAGQGLQQAPAPARLPRQVAQIKEGLAGKPRRHKRRYGGRRPRDRADRITRSDGGLDELEARVG